MRRYRAAAKKVLAAVLIAALTGCATSAPNNIKQTKFTFTLDLVDSLPDRMSGEAMWAEGHCTIKLIASEYPRCLQHELRHCIEGNFHEGYDTIEDCFD